MSKVKPTRIRSLKRFFKRIIKGKAFHKNEFGTGVFEMTVRGAIRKSWPRPVGNQPGPSKLVLEPELEGSAEPAVRIYIGSEPAQHRGERVLLWSIVKQRDPARRYEIYIMKDLAGFDRTDWKTGFTAYRYAMPGLAGFQGRAIYNDVDQIYLADPALLQDSEMSGAAVLAVDSRDTSVMLMDCEQLQDVWNVESIRTAPKSKVHATMLDRVRERNLIADLPGYWNARDHEYDARTSRLLHYTILHTQPWRPFPKDLRYRDNTNGDVWYKLEREADQERFAPLWKSQAGRPYTDMSGIFSVVVDQ